MEKLRNLIRIALTKNPIALFLLWIRPTFEGNDGKASGKRLTAFAFMVLVAYFVYADKIVSWFTLYSFLAILGSVLLVWGIITWQNITEFIKLWQNKKDKEEV